MKPEEALSYYQLEGAIDEIAPFGLGHINDTFLVHTEKRQYLLQRVNTKVFQRPEAIEKNIQLVLEHAPALFPTFEKTTEGRLHLNGSNGEFWRLQHFISDSEAPAVVQDAHEAYQIGFGFGSFTECLAQVSPDQVSEAIPNFLDLGLRIDRFETAVTADIKGRNKKAHTLISSARRYKWIHSRFLRLLLQGLPQRICHNDTKTTNILLNVQTKEFSKVIDLDTIGPGYTLFDFGDMVRSIAIQSNEGDQQGINQPLQTKLIESVKAGYLEACKESLTQAEVESLPLGSLFMTYFTGIRMLTDYLEGDIYYKIESEDDNLIRARNQLYILDLLTKYYQFDHEG